MLNRTCPACGGTLQNAANNTLVCMRCFRTYETSADSMYRVSPQSQNRSETDESEKLLKMIFFFVILIAGTLMVGAFPLTLAATIALVISLKNRKEFQNTSQPQQQSRPAPEKVVSYPTGEFLKTRADYIRRLREMPLGQMPLGIYGERAAEQIERLEVKQRGLRAILGHSHPFVKSAEDAESFILENCRKIYWRLKFCDQTDPNFCRVHAEYMQAVLNENEKILEDYEKLLIEVMQLNDNRPAAAPSLDVLAETLRQIRTGEQPEDVFLEQAELKEQAQMMMR